MKVVMLLEHFVRQVMWRLVRCLYWKNWPSMWILMSRTCDGMMNWVMLRKMWTKMMSGLVMVVRQLVAYRPYHIVVMLSCVPSSLVNFEKNLYTIHM